MVPSNVFPAPANVRAPDVSGRPAVSLKQPRYPYVSPPLATSVAVPAKDEVVVVAAGDCARARRGEARRRRNVVRRAILVCFEVVVGWETSRSKSKSRE